MASRPHATTEDQRAALGNVRRKPIQIDLLTGELVTTTPKRSNGHIPLKSIGIERPAVLGMASWAGGGPEGKRCQDCSYFGAVTVRRPDGDTLEKSSAACLRAAQRSGRLPSGRSEISMCNACDQFGEGESSKAWLIDWDGKTSDPDWRDKKGMGRFHALNEYEDPERPGFMRAPTARR